MSELFPEPERIRAELQRCLTFDTLRLEDAYDVACRMVLDAYAAGVVDGVEMGREEERRQLALPLERTG